MAEYDLNEEETTQLPGPFACVIEQIQNGQDDIAIELSLADNTGMSRGGDFEQVRRTAASRRYWVAVHCHFGRPLLGVGVGEE